MGRREVITGSLLGLLGLGGAALVGGLTTATTGATPFLEWGGLGSMVVAILGLARLYQTAPAASQLPPPEEKREYLPPELTVDVLASKVIGKTSVQTSAITSTYVGKWLRIEAQVHDVHDIMGSWLLAMRVPEQKAFFYGGFGNREHEKLRALNIGDWVTVEGPIESIAPGVTVRPAHLIHVGKMPKPPQRRKKTQSGSDPRSQPGVRAD